jgi:glutamine amidotransferase
VVPDDPGIIATRTDYGIEFASSITRDNIFACQFHPEKSQSIGLKILDNFAKLK